MPARLATEALVLNYEFADPHHGSPRLAKADDCCREP
jgi:hypothetical protein